MNNKTVAPRRRITIGITKFNSISIDNNRGNIRVLAPKPSEHFNLPLVQIGAAAQANQIGGRLTPIILNVID